MIAFFPKKICDISNTKRVQRIVLMPLGHPIILLKIELIQYGHRIGNEVYCDIIC